MADPPLSLEVEAARIEEIARRNPAEARGALAAMLDRPRRLTGQDKTLALDFNAQLCTRLRERDQARLPARRLRLWNSD